MFYVLTYFRDGKYLCLFVVTLIYEVNDGTYTSNDRKLGIAALGFKTFQLYSFE